MQTLEEQVFQALESLEHREMVPGELLVLVAYKGWIPRVDVL
jgi:hypothetical protein